MRIGVLTLHRAQNYGTALQAYALCAALRRGNAHVELIDYRCPAIEAEYRPLGPPGRSWKARAAKLLGLAAASARADAFASFRRRLPLGTPVESHEALESCAESCDALVVGSDQVWNPRITGGDAAFYLGFAPEEKRFSYAASFGFQGDYLAWRDQIQSSLVGFRGLSLREPIGMLELSRRGLEPQVHIDPSLLLRAEEYRALLGNDGNRACQKAVPAKNDGGYILLYATMPPRRLLCAARALSDRTGLPLRWIDAPLRPLCGIERIDRAGPLEFLSLVSAASMVVTNSFHGTAFSIVYERPFWAEVQDETLRLDRVGNLLTLLGLQYRILRDGDADLLAGIDWRGPRLELSRQRERAYAYLGGLGHDG